MGHKRKLDRTAASVDETLVSEGIVLQIIGKGDACLYFYSKKMIGGTETIPALIPAKAALDERT